MSQIILKDKVVAFAQITGDGRKGKKDGKEYSVAVEMSAKEKKKYLKEVEEFWEENKPKGAKKPAHDPADAFSTKEGKDGEVLWVNELVEKGITYEKAPDTDFTMKHFEKIGAGSVIDLGIRMFVWDNAHGTGISTVLSVVQLKEFTKYEGSEDSLGGTKIESDGVESSSSKKSDKKDKKKKKSKKKD